MSNTPKRLEIGVLYGFRALMVLFVVNYHFWQQSWLGQYITVGGRLFSLDKDPDAVAVASDRLKAYGCARVIQADFKDAAQILKNETDGLRFTEPLFLSSLPNPGRDFYAKKPGLCLRTG